MKNIAVGQELNMKNIAVGQKSIKKVIGQKSSMKNIVGHNAIKTIDIKFPRANTLLPKKCHFGKNCKDPFHW
jgi:hypothetical protein